MSDYMANKMDEQIEAGIQMMDAFCESVDFGDLVLIEQLRHGAKNEMYLHKVIGRLKSNRFVDIPVQGPATETIHEGMYEVIACICCGVQETKVRKYKIFDTRPNHTGPQIALGLNGD